MDSNRKPIRKQELIWREVDGEVVIISPDGRSMKMLNEVASRIWILLDGVHDVAMIASLLSSEYDEQEETIREDCQECIDHFRELNLLG